MKISPGAFHRVCLCMNVLIVIVVTRDGDEDCVVCWHQMGSAYCGFFHCCQDCKLVHTVCKIAIINISILSITTVIGAIIIIKVTYYVLLFLLQF